MKTARFFNIRPADPVILEVINDHGDGSVALGKDGKVLYPVVKVSASGTAGTCQLNEPADAPEAAAAE